MKHLRSYSTRSSFLIKCFQDNGCDALFVISDYTWSQRRISTCLLVEGVSQVNEGSLRNQGRWKSSLASPRVPSLAQNRSMIRCPSMRLAPMTVTVVVAVAAPVPLRLAYVVLAALITPVVVRERRFRSSSMSRRRRRLRSFPSMRCALDIMARAV